MANPKEAQSDGKLARVLELSQSTRGEDPAEVIHRTIDQCLLNMVFQPIVDMKTGAIFAYEALCRSRVPQYETPPAMIEAATAVGRIGELGRLQRTLASKHCPDWPIFVNISPNEFDDGWLVRPDDAIFRHRKPVYIEITESVPLVFFEQCHSVLAELRRKGALLAIDDLGAGYSNLKYIADLAPDIVKLDRDLVAGCTLEGTQYELLCSIAKLCREVNAKVVAEGVEVAEELEAVSSAGIEYCQGFFLGRPKITPSELNWPASEMLLSDSFKVNRATSVADRCETTPAETERRLGELEDVRAILEKSVRKARGEVVRLRKALSQSEGSAERSQTRLAELEDTLEESDADRKRLARLFEASTLRNTRTEGDFGTVAVKTVNPKGSFKRFALPALMGAVGLLMGLSVYSFSNKMMPSPPAPSSTSLETLEAAAPAAAGPPIVDAMAPPGVEPEPGKAPSPAEASTRMIESSSAAEAPGGNEETVRSQIRETLQSWAAAWSAQDVDGYLDHYSTEFISIDGLKGKQWAEQRRNRLGGPSYIDIGVDELRVKLEGYAYASAVFQQTYTSDSFTDQVLKEVALVLEGDRWRITSEGVFE